MLCIDFVMERTYNSIIPSGLPLSVENAVAEIKSTPSDNKFCKLSPIHKPVQWQLSKSSRIGPSTNYQSSFRNFSRHLFKSSLSNLHSNIFKVEKPLADIQIVVVGAGLAGLSAANHLIKNGFERTIILEATDRFGGRINSKQFGDAFCELGAKWVTIDAANNTVYDMLRQTSGLHREILQKDEKIYMNALGEKINRKLPELIDILYKRLCSRIELDEKYKAGDLHDLNSVHTYFQAETTKIVNTIFRGEDQKIAKDIFNSLFKEFGSLLGCCLEYVNIEHITKQQNHTASYIYIPSGLDNILNNVAKSIGGDHMKVGKPVGEINWYGETWKSDQKSVACIDGSVFSADHIICTLPLGVLKNFSNYMFKPTLPKEKLNAINNLGFGNPVKVYFEYEQNIRPWFRNNIRPLWGTKERETDRIWTKQVVEISKVPKSNRVLEILVGGAFYNEIEKLPDFEVLDEITKLLRTLLRNPTIPYPSSVLRSKWSSLACYLGGRPYFSTVSTVHDVNTLAAPLGDMPSLLFAGDATILNGFGTIDGARMSGIREAQRIIEFYKKNPQIEAH